MHDIVAFHKLLLAHVANEAADPELREVRFFNGSFYKMAVSKLACLPVLLERVANEAANPELREVRLLTCLYASSSSCGLLQAVLRRSVKRAANEAADSELYAPAPAACWSAPKRRLSFASWAIT